MSSKAIAAAAQHFLQFRIQYASIALLYWDYVLTLRDEIEYLWSRKGWLKLSNLLYILCRYALLANVLYLLAVSGKLGSGCDTWYKFVGAISVLGRAAILTVFAMRAYAVWSRNKLVLVGLGLIALTCFILDCVSVSNYIPNQRLPEGFYVSYTFQVYDAPVLQALFSTVLTTVRCIQSMNTEESILSQKNTLLYIIFEQGVLYFSVVSCFTIATVVLNFQAPNNFIQKLLNALTLPVSGLLTARFLLHLRAADANHIVLSNNRVNATLGGDEDFVCRRQTSTFRAFSTAVVEEFGEDPVFSARNRGRTASNAPENDREWDDAHAMTFNEESA
ncbi:hypothetical protein D9619_008352 [Psilocybe cf. subviscida]|uniref:DUF6533 domain-containing protein n=1 Tax=Psilocybe cf. subviscida TaxID=2480587 RepID=A0A8H5BAF5_9AGAR|nr:hypothetical protein D9619_008352 [Psilocybe cf. subviscida]